MAAGLQPVTVYPVISHSQRILRMKNIRQGQLLGQCPITQFVDDIPVRLFYHPGDAFYHRTDKIQVVFRNEFLFEKNVSHKLKLRLKVMDSKALSVQKTICCVGYLNFTSTQKASREMRPCTSSST